MEITVQDLPWQLHIFSPLSGHLYLHNFVSSCNYEKYKGIIENMKVLRINLRC